MRSSLYLIKKTKILNLENRNKVLEFYKNDEHAKKCSIRENFMAVYGKIPQLSFNNCFHFFTKRCEIQEFKEIEGEEDEMEMSATMFHVFSLLANAWDTSMKVNYIAMHVFLSFRKMLIITFPFLLCSLWSL